MIRRNPRAFLPSVDGLESRVALSTTPAPALVASTTRPEFFGSLSGRYFAPRDNRAADEPLMVDLSGSGMMQGLGRVTMTGSLRMGGFLPSGVPDITGTLTLRNARGSITLRLTGSGGGGQVPGAKFRLDASIVSGTGAYRNTRAIGAAGVLFGPSTIQSITTPTPLGGRLTVNLLLRAPVR